MRVKLGEEVLKWMEKNYSLSEAWKAWESKQGGSNESCPYEYFRKVAVDKINELLEDRVNDLAKMVVKAQPRMKLALLGVATGNDLAKGSFGLKLSDDMVDLRLVPCNNVIYVFGILRDFSPRENNEEK